MFSRGLFSYLLRFQKFAKSEVIIYIILSLFSGLLEGIGVSLFVPLLNFFVDGQANSKFAEYFKSVFNFLHIPFTLTNILWSLVIVFFVKAIFSIGVLYYRTDIREVLKNKLHRLFIHHLCLSEYSWFKSVKEANLITVLTVETDLIVNSFDKMALMIMAISNLVVYGISFILINDWKTLLIMIPGFILLPLFLKLSKKIKKGSREASEIVGNVQDNLFQLIRGFKYLKVKKSFHVFQQRLDQLFENRRSTSVRVFLMVTMPTVFSELIAVVLASTFIWLFVLKMNRPISEVLVIIVFIQRLFFNLINVISNRNSFWANIGSLDKYYGMLREMEKYTDISSSKPLHQDNKLDNLLEFKNVSFFYGNSKILNHVSFKLRAGEKIGLVGISGSGKSTLFDLGLGLLNPSEGEVLWKGENIKNLSRDEIAKDVGFIPQEPVVFNESAEKNIFWFNNDVPIDPSLKGGVTNLLSSIGADRKGDTGQSLSGGQKQKIAFLRELIHRPKIIFIDEGTSAMDSQSEKEFLGYLEDQTKISVFMIAHRLSSLKNCNRILVLNHGSIVEEGNWGELTAKPDSFFAKLLNQQAIT